MHLAPDLILLVGSMLLRAEDISMRWIIVTLSASRILLIIILFMKNAYEADHITFNHTTGLKEDIDDTSIM